MRYVLIALLAVSALAALPAKSEEPGPGSSFASLQERNITTGFSRVVISGIERNMAKIKEDEFETPEATAIIEKNREDRERTVVMDR